MDKTDWIKEQKVKEYDEKPESVNNPDLIWFALSLCSKV